MKNQKLIFGLLLFSLLLPSALAVNEPTNLKEFDKSSTYINTSWNPNANWYNTSVYLDGSWKVNKTQNVTTEYHKFTGLTKNTAYTVSIFSYNATFEKSNWVNVSITTGGSLYEIWTIIDDVVNHTSTLVGLVILGVVMAIATIIGVFITRLLQRKQK